MLSTTYFVLGAGRCGTSLVAKVLHELGVFMGERFAPKDPRNPIGYWEDLDFLELNYSLLTNKIDFHKWSSLIQDLIDKRNSSYDKWGLKDPRLSYLASFYLTLSENYKIIYCKKDLKVVAESMSKCYEWELDQAKRIAEIRTGLIEKLIRDKKYYLINFNNQIDENILRDKLKEIIQ